MLAPFAYANVSDDQVKIPYCIDPNWMPYEGIVEGQHIGLSLEYVKLFSKMTGLQFELVETATWRQTLDYLKAGKCWVTFMLNETPKRANYLNFSDIYFHSPNVLVSDSEQPFLQSLSNIGQRSLAVVKDYRLAEYIELYYPHLNVVHVSNEQQGLKLLNNGDVELFAGSMLSINARVNQGGYGNLRIAGWAGPEDELRVGVIKDHPDILQAINSAIRKISVAEHLEISDKWTNVRIVKETDYQLLYQIIAGVLVLFIAAAFRHQYLKTFNSILQQKNEELEQTKLRLEESNQKLEKLSYIDALTQLNNRHYFAKSIESEIKVLQRHPAPSTLMLLDIDFFKEVNDEFGHATGDAVLRDLGEIFLAQIRETDVAARWGGEEFIFLLRGSMAKSAIALAERIREAIAENQSRYQSNVTVSVGISEFNAEDDFISWYERTDKALYQAKNAGRNQIKVL
jgi:diguanylate cyclase (GGDEF)-like protein